MFVVFSAAFSRDDRSDVHEGPAGMEPEGVIESTWHEVYDNFDDMNLREELLRGIYGYGFEKPSAIQQRAIIPCVRGRDVIAQAQSGEIGQVLTSNKVFFIILYNFSLNLNLPQVLVKLQPSRLPFFNKSIRPFVTVKL